jgi:hypothetical protein
MECVEFMMLLLDTIFISQLNVCQTAPPPKGYRAIIFDAALQCD